MFASYFFDEMIKFNVFMIKLIIFIVITVFKFFIMLIVAVLKFIYKEIYNFILIFSSDKKVIEAEKNKFTSISSNNLVQDKKDINSFVFGTYNNKYVVKKLEDFSNILVIGGTGSGKTSCIIIPTLQHFEGNVFAIDIKNDLYINTSSYRNNIKVLSLDKKNINTFGYDVYYILSYSNNLISDIRDIVLSIIPNNNSNSDNDFWIESTQNLFTAIILYCYMKNKNFIETIDFILENNVKQIINILKSSNKKEIDMFINSFINVEDKILMNIYLQLANKVITFSTDENLRYCLSNKNFVKVNDLEYSDVYLQIDECKIEQYKNFLNLIITQFLKYFEKRKEENDKEILFVLDEFPRLGKINNILSALTTLRSRHISLCLVVQSISQIDLIYSDNVRKVICDNCNYKTILSATESSSINYIENLLNTYDKLKISKNKSINNFSITESTEEKAIINKNEIKSLVANNKILLISSNICNLIDKKPYYL